jgi:hypothetical protein
VVYAFSLVEEDVGVADDPDGPASLVDDRRGTEAMIGHEFKSFSDSSVAVETHGMGRHYVLGPERFKRSRCTRVNLGIAHGDVPRRYRDII